MVAEEKVEGRAAASDAVAAEAAGRRMVVLEDFKPVSFLDDDDRAAAVRRYSTLFVVDGRTRKGGLGRVLYAENAWGERLAVKVLVAEEGADLPEDEQQALASRREAAFRREYESSRLLTGIAGFPTLFGQGRIDGQPALIMEWVEGQTLEEARRRLSVDGDGRLSPLVAAAIGRDLFDLLSRMELVDGGLVHRDISPSNVMIRTQHASVEEQVARGKFDLVLVDFGSTVLPARASSLTVRYGAPQGATPDYAAPEMLTADVARVADMRKSPAVDVYAAASVVYLLLCGRPPFQLGDSPADGDGAEVTSDYLRKTTELPLPVRSAHGESIDVAVTLDCEGEAVAAVRKALADERLSPSNQELKEALTCVDSRVGEVVLAALEPDQRHRPSAAEMREGLAGFVESYPRNVVAALRGETLSQDWSFDERRRDSEIGSRRDAGARLGRWVAVAVALGLGCVAAMLCSGVRVTAIGSLPCSLEWGFPLVAALALAPTALGYLVRWRGGRERAGFVRGSAVLVVMAVAAEAIVLSATVEPEAMKRLLAVAPLACSSAAWCGMVVEYAFGSKPKGGFRAKKAAGTAVQADAEVAVTVAVATEVAAAATAPAAAAADEPMAGQEE